MRIAAIGLLLLAFAAAANSADAADPAYRSGVTRITVSAAEPFDVMVWYPTQAAETPFQVGPYTVTAARDAPVADGGPFAATLLSHGHLGSPLGHRELAQYLARSGFIVVAPTHIGDSSTPASPRPQRQVLEDRPRQASAALDNVLADPRFAPFIDRARIGAVGFSAGGYTVLALAGARPSLAVALTYCRAHPDDEGSCGPGQADAASNVAPGDLPALDVAPDPRIRVIIAMDPLAILFDRAALAGVRVPVLLLRPADDGFMRSAGNALAVVTGLPVPPRQMVVPGRHFIFLDPCPAVIFQAAPLLCQDAPGIDRAAIHRQIEPQIAAFLRDSLR